jgi:hypothetical protein
MTSARPPWRTGADTRERVLDQALSLAMDRSEIKSSGLTGDEVAAVVREAEPAVFAAAESAEQWYRTRAQRSGDSTIGWMDDHPVAVERVVLCFGPAIGFLLLAAWGCTAAYASLGTTLLVVGIVGGLALLLGAVMCNIGADADAGGLQSWAFFGLMSQMIGIVLWLYQLTGGWWFLAALPFIPVVIVLLIAVQSAFDRSTAVAQRAAALAAFNDWTRTLLHEGVLPVLHARIDRTP